MLRWQMLLSVVVVAMLATAAGAQDAKVLCGFAAADDLKAWDFTAGKAAVVDANVPGGKAVEIRFDPKGEYHPAYLSWNRVRGDWSGYDALQLDVINPGETPIGGTLLIADKAWADKGHSYWNRHNASATFAPGLTTWTIAVGGLYRGEAGSRNNDIKRNIDVGSIVRLDFGFGDKGSQGRVIIANLRLVKAPRPAGVWAFDFGPADQSVMLGWTPVSNKTAYDTKAGHGWTGGVPWDGAARDTTFGPALIRDFCEAGGYKFRIDVPAGTYAVRVIYESSGYWGGEQAMHARRWVSVDGKEVWSQARPDGAATALYRFEDVEPVGHDIWDTYMKDDAAASAAFTAVAAGQGLTLQFGADKVWGSRVSGLVVYRADDAKARDWADAQFKAVETEFRNMAVCLDKPAAPFALPEAWKPYGLAAWPVDIEQTVTPATLPQGTVAAPDAISLATLCARGETATWCLALRAAGPAACKLSVEPLKGPGQLPAAAYRVWYNTSRGFGTIAYHIMPHTLRPVSAMTLEKDITREIVVKAVIPADAAPGDYAGKLVIEIDGRPAVSVPIRLKVSPVVLDRKTDFRMGFFGLMPPEMIDASQRQEVLDDTLRLLREYGMNTVCGGPNWRLTGWKDGQPQIDFAEMDRFVALLHKHGFDGPINGYGGCRFVGLHEGYQKGSVAAAVEKASGLPYADALLRAWQAVDKHAREAHWPTIWYAMCDETRVVETAQVELEFMKLMAKVSATMPQTLRTSGSYSVSFDRRPTDQKDMQWWHQQYFDALDISDLNLHDESVLAEANRLGKGVHIYNQGTSRYSFGLYQWSEFRRGVTARTQWHLNVLHGYQFFDLDGREPDTAMICYGRKAIYPTIEFERCRQGASDFYLYNTLAGLLDQARKAGRSDAAVVAAAALLDDAIATTKLNARTPPAGYDADALKAKLLAAAETLAERK